MMDDSQLTLPSPEEIKAVFEGIEKALGVPERSLGTLLFQDDWSFVIKAHALVEGAVTFMLASVLDKRLSRILALTELGKDQTGKLEMAKALKLLTDGERGFIRVLSKLRNIIAHDARYFGFELTAHLASQDSQQRKAFYESMLFDVEQDKRAEVLEFVRENAKGGLAWCVTKIVLKATNSGQRALLHQEETKFHVDYAKAMMAEQSTPKGEIPIFEPVYVPPDVPPSE